MPAVRAELTGYASMTPPAGPVEDVHIEPLDPRRLEPFVGQDRVERLERTAEIVRERLGGRRIVNVNSTATGGGVAEMLQTLLGYAVGVGIDAHWIVIGGEPEFFAITKRIHNGLYGAPGDGGELGPNERDVYERTLAANAEGVLQAIQAGDVVIVHDPQPAGLIRSIGDLGIPVIWRCHVGLDGTNGWEERAWAFVRPYVEDANAFVFSRRSFAPDWIDERRLRVIPPSIDPLAPKNEDLDRETVEAVLAASGVIAPASTLHAAPVLRQVRAVREGGPPASEIPLVVQVSRWDRMKDMAGVLKGFVAGVRAETGAQLVLAGPAVDTVGDDPEDREIWEETVALWQSLPAEDRTRVHLVAVPMDDPAENAIVINALQRHAAVVVQKSLAEGFGLTVAEAMWKSRPVVASAVGGIVDQIMDEETGLLLHDPNDLEAFGGLLARLVDSPAEAARLGENARRHVSQFFLPDRQLFQYAALLEQLLP
jgi:trehalose synthase